jgi:hypothetical protein
MSKQSYAGESDGRLRVTFGIIVVAFMGLSLVISATGTARFATAMGYDERAGYFVGVTFDLAKAIVPVVLLVMISRRTYARIAVIGAAWLGLVIYSALATHATVGLAVSEIDRTASWKMETRSNKRAELEKIEQRLEVLSKPHPPRPAMTVSEALAREQVPAGVWRKSRECQRIRRSKYFQKACAQVLELRTELAAAQDYERLNRKAEDLRKALAASPIVATSDPLPESFDSTVGRVVPFEGKVGIALLITVVTEIFSCFGLAALRALRPQAAPPNVAGATSLLPREPEVPWWSRQSPKTTPASSRIIPPWSETGYSLPHGAPGRDASTALPGVGAPVVRRPQSEAAHATREGPAGSRRTSIPSNVPAFVRDRLRNSTGQWTTAAALFEAYKAWCATRGETPVSQQKLGVELKQLKLGKWKSNGRMHYRDVELVV